MLKRAIGSSVWLWSIPAGIGLTFVAFLLADGPDRPLPQYFVPGYNCDSWGREPAIVERPSGSERTFRENEPVACYPPGLGAYYLLAAAGALILTIGTIHLAWPAQSTTPAGGRWDRPWRGAGLILTSLVLGALAIPYSGMLEICIMGCEPRPSDAFQYVALLYSLLMVLGLHAGAALLVLGTVLLIRSRRG